MKNTINYFYNLFPDKIIKQGEIYYFWIAEDKYYFVPFKNNKKKVLDIYGKLISEKRKVNKILFNRDNDIITKYKNVDYTLLVVDCIENELVELKDFFNIPVNSKVIDWGQIWERKIDYFEYQVNQRALGKNNVLNSFSYYVGLGENAIQYYNMIEKNDANIGVQHKRVYADNYEINYYNPLNMVIDYNVRDIAEFIKFSFFNDKLNVDKIINHINSLNMSNTMFNLFYARLLFPTYYFDHYESYINDEEDENILLNIINKSLEYEIFLKKIYTYYSNKYQMFRIEWLLI